MFRTVLVAMLAVVALSAVAASAAQAEEAAFFKVAGARLAKGESKEVNTKAVTKVLLSTEWVKATCSLTFVSGAKLLGSPVGEPGTGEMTIELSGCKISGFGEGCSAEKLREPVRTEPLLARLVNIGSTHNGVGVEFYPKQGGLHGGGTFLKDQLVGKKCDGPSETIFSGSLVAEVHSGGKLVERGKEPAEGKAIELVFPVSPITEVWWTRGEVGANEGAGLTSDEAVELTEGGSTLELAGEPAWGVFQ